MARHVDMLESSWGLPRELVKCLFPREGRQSVAKWKRVSLEVTTRFNNIGRTIP